MNQQTSAAVRKREKELQVLCDPEHGLPAILGVSEETIREKAENRTSYWQVLQYKVEKEKADEVEAFIKEYNVNCITLSQGTKRVYPFDDLAASVLGFVNAYDNRGAYGLENPIITRCSLEAKDELCLQRMDRMVKCHSSTKNCMSHRMVILWF